MSYLAFGSLFPSPSQPDAVHCLFEVLARAWSLSLPVAAFGDIALDNADVAVRAGADGLAVSDGLFDAADIEAPTRQFQDLFDPY